MGWKLLLAGVLMLGTGTASAAPIGLAIKSAAVQTDSFTGQPTIAVELQPSAQRSFAKLTARHVGEILDLIVDGTVVSSPRIQAPVLGPSVMISGNFTASEAATLARRISDGDAVVEVELASE